MKKCLLFLLLGFLTMPRAYGDVMQGTVNSVVAGRIMVSLWGSVKQEDFKITDATLLHNIRCLDDLDFGDKVKIYYGGHGYYKTAYSITKQVPTKGVVEF